ncbi:hypothetical protein Tco_1510017 [Tanacetum coccineum]
MMVHLYRSISLLLFKYFVILNLLLGELKIKRRSVIDKDGLFWGKGRSTGGGGGSLDANNVTENLVFTALLSLPESLTKQQKVEQAEAVINQLGLTTYEPTSGLVLLLSEGNPLFFGNGSEIMDYFQSIGFSPSVAMNPVDFLLDLANGISSDESSQDDQNAVKQKFVLAYKSNLDENLKAETLDVEIQLNDVSDHKNSDQWSTTWVQQLMILLRKGLKERRHKSFIVLNIAQVIVITLFCDLLWWQLDTNHIQDQGLGLSLATLVMVLKSADVLGSMIMLSFT